MTASEKVKIYSLMSSMFLHKSYANRALQWVDSVLDSLALFFEKRHREVKKEISRLSEIFFEIKTK
jgi:hypothetical protein